MDFSKFDRAVGKIEGGLRAAERYLKSDIGEPDVPSAVAEYSRARNELASLGSLADTPKHRERYDKVLGRSHAVGTLIIEKGLVAVRNDADTAQIYIELMGNASPSQYQSRIPKPPSSPYAFQGPKQPTDPFLQKGGTPYEIINSTISRAETALGSVRQVAEAENRQNSFANIDTLKESMAGLRRALETKAKNQ